MAATFFMANISKVPGTISGTEQVLNNCANNSISVFQMGKDFEYLASE